MSFGMNRETIGKGTVRILEAADTGIGLGQVPKHRAVTRIEFSRLFEVRNRVTPAALSPIDRARGVPHLGIVRRSKVSDGQFRARQLVIAIAVIVILRERETRIAKIRLKPQRAIRRQLGLGQAPATPVVPKPIEFAVNARSQAVRDSEVRIALDGVVQQVKRALTVFARIS